MSEKEVWGMFAVGVGVGALLALVLSFLLLIGGTNGYTFVRDGVRYGSVCESAGKLSCGDWYIVGDAVEFVPTPVVKED